MKGIKKYDLTGRRFEYWVVLNRSHSNERGAVYWTCLCKCGNKKTVLASTLINGESKSCGCLRTKLLKDRCTHGMTGTSFYERWRSMLSRCRKTSGEAYNNYGKRGITVCKRWEKYDNFYKDMFLSFSENLELDRKNNDKGYYKSNCRWVTRKVNDRNRRDNKYLSFRGATLTISEWAEIKGIKYGTIQNRIKKNWPIEYILSTKKWHKNNMPPF